MFQGIQNIFMKARSSVHMFIACALLAVATIFVSPAWAADNGVYAFICEGNADSGGYILVIKNGDGEPSEGDYGKVVKSYPTDLLGVKSATNAGVGWPWNTSTLDSDAAQVKKVVFDGGSGSVSLTYTRYMFANFTKCTKFDFTELSTGSYVAASYGGMLQNVYNATDNPNIVITLGSNNKITSLGITPPDSGFYRKNIDTTYDRIPSASVPANTACTLYTQKPEDCDISIYLGDYEIKFPDSFFFDDITKSYSHEFDGVVTHGGANSGVTLTLKTNSNIIAPSRAYTLAVTKQNEASWDNTNNRRGIGHYRVRATVVSSQGYATTRTTTDYAEFDITVGGELTLFSGYSDGELQNPVNSTGLSLSEPTDLYVKCATALSGRDGSAEMKINAISSDAQTLTVETPVKVGEYIESTEGSSGYFVYKIALSPVNEGTASVSLNGYTMFTTLESTGTNATVLPVGVVTQESTLTLGDDAQGVLSGLLVQGETVEVDLAYVGRDIDGIAAGEIIVQDPEYLNALGEPEYTIATASYNIATGKLSVTPTQTGFEGRLPQSGILRVTVPGAGLNGTVTKEITVKVSKRPTEYTATLDDNTPLPQTLVLKPGEERQITFTNTGEGLNSIRNPSINSAIAVIDDWDIASDGKSVVITVLAKEAQANPAILSFEWYRSNVYLPLAPSFEVRVSKVDSTLSVSPASLSLTAGQSDKATVSYTGDGTIEVASDKEDVATATFDPDTMELSVEALSAGTATITLSAAETTTTKPATSTLQVTVSPAPATVTGVTITPPAPTMQKGSTQQLSATVNGTNSPPQTVTWSVSGGTGNTGIASNGVLNVDANETATTLTVTATSTFDSSKFATITVTLNAAPPEPTYAVSLDTVDHTFPAATVGYAAQGAKTVTVTNTGTQATGLLTIALGGKDATSFTVSPTSLSSIIFGGQSTFTIVPKTGLAVGTYSAKVTISGSNNISNELNVNFTVNAKPVKELPALALQVGAKATSTIALLDKDGKPLAGSVNVSGFDTEIVDVKYDATTQALSILALAKGETVINLASDAAAESYTMKVTISAAATPAPTLDAGSTGVKVSGTVKNIPEGAAVSAIIRAATSGTAFDSLSAEASGKGLKALNLFEVVLTVNGKEVHDGFGSLTLSFPVDASYEGKEVTLLHLHHDGRITSETVRVSGGFATIKVSDLSTFAVTALNPSATNNTGSTGSLVTGTGNTGSTGSSNTSGTGSLVSNNGSSGSSNSTGSLVTSQSGTSDGADTDALADTTGTATFGDTDTPLTRTSAFDTAGSGSQSNSNGATGTSLGGMDPWLIAGIIAAVVLVAGGVLWFILRRRRRLAAEVFAAA